MKGYKPERMVAVSHYQKVSPTLSGEIREDIYRRMETLIEGEKEKTVL